MPWRAPFPTSIRDALLTAALRIRRIRSPDDFAGWPQAAELLGRAVDRARAATRSGADVPEDLESIVAWIRESTAVPPWTSEAGSCYRAEVEGLLSGLALGRPTIA